MFDRGRTGAAALQKAVRSGLPYRAFESLGEALELRTTELAELVGVAPRTLTRRRGGTLTSIESDRLYGIAHVASLAAEALGSLDRARDWLRRANRALAGQPPIRCLDTEIGRRQVEDLLQRINYGTYS
ncbi:MAG TPA: antitoxin Xre/MbcA/ParS toxin-binding domain-containing protein [Candidatus Polarisedimenticolaceae bacterium]|nr:antitoxin Xre/MbcA/ParS toxin-binding domain-containing protein [Candidatus Polarisedimenticolaceae bacterium]